MNMCVRDMDRDWDSSQSKGVSGGRKGREYTAPNPTRPTKVISLKPLTFSLQMAVSPGN